MIKSYFGDGGRFGVSLTYYEEAEDKPLGTAGALFRMLPDLPADFLLLNGDIVFDIDVTRLAAFHRGMSAAVTLVVHPNNHPYDSAVIVTADDGRVTGWLNKEDPRRYYRNQVNAGIHVISRAFLEDVYPSLGGKVKVDLDRDLLKPVISGGVGADQKGIFAYRTPEYIKDMGTPERLREAEADIAAGRVARRSLALPQRAVFLDRDGTLNEPRGFIRRPDDLTLLPGAAEGVKKINGSGFLAIVVTNQPVIARGEATLEDLRAIHDKLETELGRSGAFIDDLFFCPHHPDRGFDGERPEYKIDCGCRKPKPGLLLRAAERYHIDLAASYMVGDGARDVEAGINAGARPALLAPPDSPEAKAWASRGVPVFPCLPAFCDAVLGGDR